MTVTKEANEVKWRGIKLASPEDYLPVQFYTKKGTQVLKDGDATSETTEIHEVTATTTLFLNTWKLCGRGSGNGTASLVLRDTGDDVKLTLAHLDHKAGEPTAVGLTHLPPVEIAAGWDIAVVSDAANVTAHAMIHGFEI